MPFYFAWTDDSAPFDPATMLVEDEIVFAFNIAHLEGQVATLTLDVKNPKVGLLAPGRKRWCWLSYSDPTSGAITPLFNGWLIGLPANLLAEVATLEFLARPVDFLAQKQELANAMMVEPWYDPIWINADKYGDPDTVLETYSRSWHVDRVTHEVTTSDIIFGEDGTEIFLPEDSFYDSVELSFASAPTTQVNFKGSVTWTQTASGIITMPQTSLSAWNGDQIVADWPKPGDDLGAGWSVYYGQITETVGQTNVKTTAIDNGGNTISIIPDYNTGFNSGNTGSNTNKIGNSQNTGSSMPKKESDDFSGTEEYSWKDDSPRHSDGDLISQQERVTRDVTGNFGSGRIVSESENVEYADMATGAPKSYSYSVSWKGTIGKDDPTPSSNSDLNSPDTNGTASDAIPALVGNVTVQYELSRKRTETINFTMNSIIQDIVVLAPDEPLNKNDIDITGADVGTPIDPDGAMPIGDIMRGSFFPTDRGILAIEYCLLLARATLLMAARAVKLQFDCTFERALSLSCRKNAVLFDSRLPGGSIEGKITEYHIIADGDKGEMKGQIIIESTPGTGESPTVSTGTPSYVDEGYVAVNYQFYEGATVLLPSSDATIVLPDMLNDDDGLVLPLTYDQAVLAYQIHVGDPVDFVDANGYGTANPTWLEIVLTPVTDQDFTMNYDLGTSELVVPELIDLAAPSDALARTNH